MVQPAELNLRADVDMLAGLIGPRNGAHPDGLASARKYLRKRIEETGLPVAEQNYAIPTRSAVNLIATIPGKNPHKPPLVVGAHYDTARFTPGADDNASAVAILLEIIRALATAPLNRTVRCVFYDCEEPPHFGTPQMGSYQHARSLHEAGEKIHGMICLESLGYFPKRVSDRVVRPKLIRFLDALFGGNYVVIVSDIHSFWFGLAFVLRFCTSGFFKFAPAALPQKFDLHSLSDHRNYWHFNYRALMVTNTAMFRNPNYHEPTDLPATLDYAAMTTLARMLSRATRRTCR